MSGLMCGAYLPGGRTVELRDVPVPVPGHAQVLVAMRASTICGSDLRAIYREHGLLHIAVARRLRLAARRRPRRVPPGRGATCIRLPDELSYLDGACVACGFATAYEALRRAGVSGADAVLVTGMGPVGLAAGILARALGSKLVISVDVSEERLALAASRGVARWDVHPELTVTDSFPLPHAAEAYRVADEGRRGKVGLEVAP